jgi:hypothetical protein
MTTVHALRNRGLVSVAGRGARATVKVTEAGRQYLIHGSYPAAGHEVEVRAVRPSRTAARIDIEELLQRLHETGGRLRIIDPDRQTRAAWRSVINRAKKDGLPEGWFLRHHGRDRGDLVIELGEGPHPASAYLTRVTAARERPVPVETELRRPHPCAEALQLELASVSPEQLQRAVRIVHALATEAERRGYAARAGRQPEQGQIEIIMADHPYTLTISEETNKLAQQATAEEQRQEARDPWAKSPRHDKTWSGRLVLQLPHRWDGRRYRWADRRRWRLEDKLADVLAALEDLAATDAERHRNREARQAAERHQWEQAIEDAREQALARFRANLLDQQAQDWVQAARIRDYTAALQRALKALRLKRHDAEQVSAWISWAEGYADQLDPLTGPLPTLPPQAWLPAEALRPFLLQRDLDSPTTSGYPNRGGEDEPREDPHAA